VALGFFQSGDGEAGEVKEAKEEEESASAGQRGLLISARKAEHAAPCRGKEDGSL
jgi:hypothetical protein